MTCKPTIDALATHPAVYSVNLWEGGSHKRSYVTLVGMDRGFRGDTTCKIYFDHNRGELVVSPGKGIRTDAFIASYNALIEAFEVVIQR